MNLVYKKVCHTEDIIDPKKPNAKKEYKFILDDKSNLSEEDAKAMIVRGFAYPISKELPVEYAVEMNNLINLELEGAIG